MRGGAQSHLIEAEDGHFYVVKFVNNPQHRRILVNEWLCCAFLRHLQIHVPETQMIHLTPEFLAANPEVCVQLGSRREPVPAGWHFGSRVSVHPERVAIYDFLPDALLDKLENRVEFLGTFVFDKWVSNADSRQAIFFRARLKHWTPLKGEAPNRIGFLAQMIDHGFAFEGPHWRLTDSPLHGIYFRTAVYEMVTSLDSFQPWLDMVRYFPEDVIDEAWKQIPREWIEDDEEPLEELLEQLLKRRGRVEQLILATRKERPKLFPNWR